MGRFELPYHRAYPTDMTDEQWHIIQRGLPPSPPIGAIVAWICGVSWMAFSTSLEPAVSGDCCRRPTRTGIPPTAISTAGAGRHLGEDP